MWVSSITPSVGSNSGGTKLTNKGGNFALDARRNQVTIGKDLIVCNIYGNATETEFQCITQANTEKYEGP